MRPRPLGAACALAIGVVSAVSGEWTGANLMLTLNLYAILGAALAGLLLVALLGRRGRGA